ncbi:GNAT family N-acetyltransferase [Rhodohalobacter halophilus]|uniref:GNAT family N-acetyltransferase n=1 Tax=Rhodohalobacter halophilus TaxID=1812810 RepID=UPI00083FD5E3|nr:GNAT family N-acetyltransferase [Rhodohalobacter halophilus]
MQFTRFKGLQNMPSTDLYEILKLRQDIFIIEQTCIYDDIDGRDSHSDHLLLKEDGNLIAYSRIVPPGDKFSDVYIGRIVVHKDHRGRGLGKMVVKESLKWVHEMEYDRVFIEAQAHLKSFYKELGFAPCSDVYDEDGIPHLQMVQQL